MKACIYAGLLLCLGTLPAYAQDYEDDGTPLSIGGTSVHICADHGVMRGVDAGHNRFMCTHALVAGTPFIDKSTQVLVHLNDAPYIIEDPNANRTSVHVCPEGSAMIGWHQGFNWLICAPVAPFPFPKINQPDGPVDGTQAAEPNNPKITMHVCGIWPNKQSVVMVGIFVVKNVLICNFH